MVSVNDWIKLYRRRYYAAGEGSEHPIDRLVDAVESTVSVGVRKLCCQLGIAGRSFALSVQNLKEAAQVSLSEETFRRVVESEGKAVLKVSKDDQLELDWSAAECKTTTPQGAEVSRLNVSADGVLVPTTTQVEKAKRRATVLAKRQKMPPEKRRALRRLGAVKAGSDQRYKQVYVTCLYDQKREHRLLGVTRKKHRELGKLLKREAARVHLRAADERVGLVDGAVCLRRHLEDLPFTGVMTILGAFALSGFPPFSIFMSELLITLAAFRSGNYLIAGWILFFLALAFAGIIFHFSKIVFGPAPAELSRQRIVLSGALAFILPLFFMILFGLWIPWPADQILATVSEVLRGL